MLSQELQGHVSNLQLYLKLLVQIHVLFLQEPDQHTGSLGVIRL